MDPETISTVMTACYDAGAVDLERTSGRTIGFERKPLRADVHRGDAEGGQGIYIGDQYSDEWEGCS